MAGYIFGFIPIGFFMGIFEIKYIRYPRFTESQTTATKQQLDQMLKIVEEFSTDIQMQFGMDKCRTLYIVKGKIQHGDFQMQSGDNIEVMQQCDTYKYLGMKQTQRINHQTIKEELTSEYVKQVKQVLKTTLHSKNMFKAISSYACSVLGYKFDLDILNQI